GIRDYKVTGVQTCALPISIEWNRTGLDRLEPVAPVLCCAGAAKTYEGRVQRRRPLICGMVIAAMRVGLPDFDYDVGYWYSVAIKIGRASCREKSGMLESWM